MTLPIRKRDAKLRFYLGLDLDGCVADFYGKMREIYSKWSGTDISELTKDVSYGLPEWGLDREIYDDLHRFAVVQQQLFKEVEPVKGAPEALRQLSQEGVEIRIITHRLFLNFFHSEAASQTIEWLEKHWIPYRELCFVKDKWDVMANVYLEDYEENILELKNRDKKVICFSNSTNRKLNVDLRADNWGEAADMIRDEYYSWSESKGLPIPEKKGQAPLDLRPEKVRWGE